MGTQPSASQPTPLTRKALDWLLVLRSPHVTKNDFEAFRVWRDAHPEHLLAWQQLVCTIDGDSLDTFNQQFITARDKRPLSFSRRQLITALGGIALGGTALALASETIYPLHSLTADASTGTSERRIYTLSDDSKLTLDARSSVNLSYTPYLRQLHLRSGAIALQMHPDEQRPFIAVTSEGVIRASNARYMIRQDAHRTLVVAHDQPAHIQTRSGSRYTLQPGYGLRFDSSRIGEPSQAMATRASWENGYIIATGTTLSEIITILRPYYSGTLRITAAAGGLPVHGQYSLDDVDGTLRQLENDLPIKVQRFTPWVRSIAITSTDAGLPA